jgi:hypothetical protein
MGWIQSANPFDPTAKATFGFVFYVVKVDDTTVTGTFSGSYHDNSLGVALKGLGRPQAGASARRR